MDMKKALLILLIFIQALASYSISGATASLPNLVAGQGQVVVPVTVTAMNGVAAISLYFSYDPAILTFTGYQNPALSGTMANAFQQNGIAQVGISWSNATGVNISDGTLIELLFTYTSGSGSLNFLPSCEITDEIGNPINIAYTNGSISPLNPALVSFTDMLVSLAPGSTIPVPLNVNFSSISGGVGSFTFVFAYDPAVLTYQSVVNTALSAVTITQLTSPTRLSIEWSDLNTGSDLNGKLLDVNFTYHGGSSALDFETTSCAVGNNNNMDVPVVYTNGSVAFDPASAIVLTAGSVLAAPGGVLVALTSQNFSNIGAFDLQIKFDPAVLDFTGLTGTSLLSGITANAAAGVLYIAWDAATGSPLNLTGTATLLNMNFNFSNSSSVLDFVTDNCVVSDYNLNSLFVTYVNGQVSETASANATIGTVTSPPNAVVNVPVACEGFSGIGAFDFAVSVPVDKLTFIDVTNLNAQLASGSLETNISNGLLYIGWHLDPSASQGITILQGDTLFGLRFSYLQGDAPLEFVPLKCEVSNYGLSAVLMSYVDGSVSEPVSSQLNIVVFPEGLYNTQTDQLNKAKDYVGGVIVDKFAGSVADQITVELHDPATYATVVFTASNVDLNQDGTCSVTVPVSVSGSYYVTVKQRNHIEMVSATALAFNGSTLIHNFTTAAANAYGNNQVLLETGVYGMFAGDVDQDGSINGSDRSLVNSGAIAITQGYVAQDVDGSGTVGGTDRSIVNSATITIIQRSLP
jgi:hypothetical protein